MEHNSYYNPGGLSGAGVINTPQWRSAECPSTNAHGTASGVARVYAALINPENKAIVDPAALKEAITEQVYGQDLVLHRPSRFGLGFQLTQPERPIGPGQATFGHFGARRFARLRRSRERDRLRLRDEPDGPALAEPPHPSPGGRRIRVPVTRIKVVPGASVLQRGNFMMDVTDLGGQNWLIMPAARAVNEAAPANISRQRWLLVMSGVAVVNMQGKTSDDSAARRDPHPAGHARPAGLRHQPVRHSPAAGNRRAELRSRIPAQAVVAIRRPQLGLRPGPVGERWFRRRWLAALTVHLRYRRLLRRQVNGLFTGIIVSAAARDSDAWPYRVGYKITLTGRIVFTQIIIQQAGVRGNVPGTLTA